MNDTVMIHTLMFLFLAAILCYVVNDVAIGIVNKLRKWVLRHGIENVEIDEKGKYFLLKQKGILKFRVDNNDFHSIEALNNYYKYNK